MSRVLSTSSNRPYGLARVSRAWELSRSTLYAQRQRAEMPRAKPPQSRRWHSDDELLTAIRKALKESPWVGEGYRKVWAALRASEVRTSMRRVLRLMRQHDLLAPQRTGSPHGPKAHDGTITTTVPDEMWGMDATATLTRDDGSVTVFVVVDHATAECVSLQAAHRGRRFEAIDALREGVHFAFGRYAEDAASGLTLRHDHGSPFVAELFQKELTFLGIESSPAYVREPEGNGCAERFIRTLKEQLLWLRRFDTLADLQHALISFQRRYNELWRIERHGFLSPSQQRSRILASLKPAA